MNRTTHERVEFQSEERAEWLKLAPGHYAPNTLWNSMRPHTAGNFVEITAASPEVFTPLTIKVPAKGKVHRHTVRRYGPQ